MPITKKSASRILILFLLIGLSGCASVPPSKPGDLCSVFRENDDWYAAALDSQKKWGTPIHVQMAIMHHESHFRSDARPPRSKLLGVIPWTRPSSAYGYAQAKDGTWDWYISKTGNSGADRDDFEDAIDFVGWYTNTTNRINGISKWDAYNQYLAYHDGHGGYKRGTWKKKAWLIKVAKRVQQTAGRYSQQLKRCKSSLSTGSSFWPF